MKKQPRELISRSLHKFLDAATDIHQNPDEAEAAFMARQLVQCTLPHSNPGKVEAWQRTSGNLSLVIQPGWDAHAHASIGYPYGSIPRLLLFWLTTEAVRTKTRRISLGNTLAEFMRELGLDPSHGGKKSDPRRLKEQMRRLFSSRISFQQRLERDDGAQGERWLNMDVAPKGEYWWDPKSPEQGALWGSWLELGEDFFYAITASPVPVDIRALRALKQSPLALDLYAWATYRTFAATKKGQPQFISWKQLSQQLGTDYADPKDFKKKAKETFRKVEAVYPALVLKPARGGFTLYPSSTAISPRRAQIAHA